MYKRQFLHQVNTNTQFLPLSTRERNGAARGASSLPSPAQATTVVVADNGVVGVGRYTIAIGREWRRRHARVHHDDTHAAIFIDHQLIRAVTLDPTRRYQPSGLSQGRRPKP